MSAWNFNLLWLSAPLISWLQFCRKAWRKWSICLSWLKAIPQVFPDAVIAIWQIPFAITSDSQTFCTIMLSVLLLAFQLCLNIYKALYTGFLFTPLAGTLIQSFSYALYKPHAAPFSVESSTEKHFRGKDCHQILASESDFWTSPFIVFLLFSEWKLSNLFIQMFSFKSKSKKCFQIFFICPIPSCSKQQIPLQTSMSR